MTQFITQSSPVGSVPAIPNALASAELDTAILTDPLKIRAYKDSLADQINKQSAGPKFTDLSDRISSVRIETSAQGASILVLELLDPLWVIPMSGMIQVDDSGFLWPPIDVNFPTGTDCVWRLCQYRAVWDGDMTTANLTLTFEDRIAALLRQMSALDGISQGQANQTLGGFIKQLVDNANSVLKVNPPIRLVEMISPQDPNYTPPITQLPSSAQSPLRQNPNKLQQSVSQAQQTVIDGISRIVGNLIPGSGDASIRDIESTGLGALGFAKAKQMMAQGSQVWAQPGSGAGNAP